MNLIFIHQRAPGQFRHIAPYLAARGHRVVLIGQRDDDTPPGVAGLVYHPADLPFDGWPRSVAAAAGQMGNGLAVRDLLVRIADTGQKPDLIVGHAGFGELSFVKTVWPDVALLGYFEFHYRSPRGVVGFDPEMPTAPESGVRARLYDVADLMAFEDCDWGLTATDWQKSLYPAHRRDKLSVLHEGVDTDTLCPDPSARLTLADGRVLTTGDEVVTFAARGLEPVRGFPSFMRAVPAILSARPQAQIVVAGGRDPVYGPPPGPDFSWKDKLVAELGPRFNPQRVHFTGWLSAENLRALYRLSRAHVYLSYPFVASWSLLEAMASGAPLVGSDTGPVTEFVVHDKTGLVVDFFSPDAIAQSVLKLLADRDLALRLGRAARARMVDAYDFTRVIAPRFERLIGEVAAGRHPAA